MKLTRSEFQNYIHSYETDEIFTGICILKKKDTRKRLWNTARGWTGN